MGNPRCTDIHLVKDPYCSGSHPSNLMGCAGSKKSKDDSKGKADEQDSVTVVHEGKHGGVNIYIHMTKQGNTSDNDVFLDPSQSHHLTPPLKAEPFRSFFPNAQNQAANVHQDHH